MPHPGLAQALRRGFGYTTGLERELNAFPAPEELWSRFRAAEGIADPATAERLLTPCNLTTGKPPYYYQAIAVNRVVQAILQGQRRVLVTMATGTGKTVVAFQICWKLWSSRNGTRRVGVPARTTSTATAGRFPTRNTVPPTSSG